MKLRKALLAFSSVLLLTSCFGAGGNATLTPVSDYFDTTYLAANAKVEEHEAAPEPRGYFYKNAGQLGTEVTVRSYDYASAGLLVTQNAWSNIGFYSIPAGKYLIANSFSPTYLNFNVQLNADVGYFLRTDYKGLTTLYDSLGNTLVKDVAKAEVEAFGSMNVDKVVYYYVQRPNTVFNFFRLNDEGKIDPVEFIPAPIIPAEESKIPGLGQTYEVEAFDLSGYANNLKGYKIFGENDSYYARRPDGSLVGHTSFSIYDFRGIIGMKIVLQHSYALDNDVTSYDYSDGSRKYALETKLIDLNNGSVTTVTNKGILLTSIAPFKDAAGNSVYGYSVARRIDPSTKCPLDQREYVLKDDFSIVGDASYIKALDLIKLPNGNFYNGKTHILYNASFAEIAALRDMGPQLNYDAAGFIGRRNNKYGFVNYEGRVTLAFEYDEIVSNWGKDIIARSDSKYYACNLVNGDRRELDIKTLERVGTDFYRGTKDTLVYYFNYKGDTLFFADKATLEVFREVKMSFGYKESESFALLCGPSNILQTYCLTDDRIPFANMNTVNSEVTNWIPDGSQEHPFVLLSGTQGIAYGMGQYTYLLYNATAVGQFSISKVGELPPYIEMLNPQGQRTGTVTPIPWGDGYYFSLDEINTSYRFRFSNPSYIFEYVGVNVTFNKL